MTKEPIEMHLQDNFDYASHIAEFLQTSAVYLGVDADQVMALSQRQWQPIPVVFEQEAHHA